jgi:phosphoribosylformimino-5-aminoimidazole carboxamide ribotide isomerase
VIPAIDLRGGRVVRLEQGDFERESRHADDPVAVATAFADEGARWLHVVDLDGARAGRPMQAATVDAILKVTRGRVAVEVAGGVRTTEDVAASLDRGASRVVLGTAALRDPALVEQAVATHGPDRVAVAIDVRDGRAVGEAWGSGSEGVAVADAVELLMAAGVTTFEVTAIERDGTLAGPDVSLYRRVLGFGAAGLIASAGVAALDDIATVQAIGCDGVIVGRALYDGRFTLREALEVAARDPAETLLTARVRRRVERDYPGADRDTALDLLVGLDLGSSRAGREAAGRERIHAALLMLAGGDVRRLASEAAEAARDWRDTLVAADLAGDDWPSRVESELGPPS